MKGDCNIAGAVMMLGTSRTVRRSHTPKRSTFGRELYLLVNKRRDACKVLVWDGLHEDTAPGALREMESLLLSPASGMSCIASLQSPWRLRRSYVSPSLATANRARRGGAMSPCARRR